MRASALRNPQVTSVSRAVGSAPIWVRQGADGMSLGARGCPLLTGREAAWLWLPLVWMVHMSFSQTLSPTGRHNLSPSSQKCSGAPYEDILQGATPLLPVTQDRNIWRLRSLAQAVAEQRKQGSEEV